jgi:hypothetical protein
MEQQRNRGVRVASGLLGEWNVVRSFTMPVEKSVQFVFVAEVPD